MGAMNEYTTSVWQGLKLCFSLQTPRKPHQACDLRKRTNVKTKDQSRRNLSDTAIGLGKLKITM